MLVFSSWPKGCEFDPGSWQFFGERGSHFLLILEKLVS